MMYWAAHSVSCLVDYGYPELLWLTFRKFPLMTGGRAVFKAPITLELMAQLPRCQYSMISQVENGLLHRQGQVG